MAGTSPERARGVVISSKVAEIDERSSDAERAALTARHGCDLARLPERMRERFVELEPDDAIHAFLDSARHARASRVQTLLHSALCQALSDFDANALLGIYPMFLASTAHWRRLLRDNAALERKRRLLDVGAGCGGVTVTLAPLFDEVVTTELSRGMAWRLRQRGFCCERRDVATDGAPDPPYDTVACLNVLDRCLQPRSLLEKIAEALRPGGTLIVALALPYSPFAYEGPLTVDPIQRLPLPGAARAWEEAATSLVEAVIEPLGFELATLARAPYVSAGDSKRPLYVLDDVIVVARRRQ